MLSAPFLTPAETEILLLLSALVERFGVSRMRDFCQLIADNQASLSALAEDICQFKVILKKFLKVWIQEEKN